MLFHQFGQVLRDDRRRRLPRLRLLLRGYTAQHQRGGTSHGLTRSDVGFESVSDDERLFLPCAEFFQGEFHQERKWLACDDGLHACSSCNHGYPRARAGDFSTRGGKCLVSIGGIEWNAISHQQSCFHNLFKVNITVNAHNNSLPRWRLVYKKDFESPFLESHADAIFTDHEDLCATRKLLCYGMCHALRGCNDLPGFHVHAEFFQNLHILFRGPCAVIRCKDEFQTAFANALKNGREITNRCICLPDDAVHIQDEGFDVRGDHSNFFTRYFNTGPSIHAASGSARSSKFSLPINSLNASRNPFPFFK